MKKLTKLLSVFALAGAIGTGMVGMYGCDKNDEHVHTYSDKWTADGAAGHYHLADCGHDGEHTETVPHGTANSEGKCPDCGYQLVDVSAPCTEHSYTWEDNGDGTHKGTCSKCDAVVEKEPHIWNAQKVCSRCGHEMTATDVDADDLSALPVVVETFEDKTGEAAQVGDPLITEKTGDGAALENGDVEAEFEFDPATLSTVKYTDGWTNGTFSIGKNTEIRGRIKTGLYEGDTLVDATYISQNSVKLGDSTSSLEIKIPAAGTLVFYVQNGSSGVEGTQTVVLTKPDGTTEDIAYAAAGSGSTIQRITKQLEEEGTYKITRKSGTSDIYYAKFTTTLGQSAVESIEIANEGKTQYLVGQQLDCTSVAVVRKHKTGVIIPVPAENVEIDASAYNPKVAGTYEIKVKYTLEGNLDSDKLTFETSYEVEVYDYGELSVSVEHVKQGPNSAAGNGTYVNNAFRQFYTVGEAFSAEGISLSVVGKLGEKTKSFKLDASVAEITGADLTTAGVQTVKIAYTINGITKAKGVLIFVREKPEDIDKETSITVAVNAKFAEKNVGTKNTYGAYRFRTIQQALEFLSSVNADENTPKTMCLEEGTYHEKVEVNVPNLTVIGKGADKTKIEYDALYGVEDAGGFVHITDSTATFNVRDKAAGFTIRGVTISNYYNSAESYVGAASNDCRALAMLVQADKVVVEDCTLLGYQDTLELFTGRQLFRNCLIMGVTDYIFGTNNTTYFYKCEIRNINHKSASQPGYVTAFKGNNKGSATDKVTYGAIFDDCDFTADAGVPEGKCAMGRAWGTDAAVMVMNSRIGGHISKGASTSAGGRYISMGNGDPTGAQFREYNNTGAGAITADLATVKVLTQAQAADYNNFEVIFGKVNNLVSYSSAWDGSYGSKVTEKTFNFDDIAEGVRVTEGDEFIDLYDGLSFSGQCNVQASKSQAQFYAGSVLKVGMKGKVTVTFYGGDYGNESNGRIVYKDGYATIYIVGNHNNIYITKITVDKTAEPEDTVEHTVTIYDGENVLAKITVNNGSKITLKDIRALITGDAYAGKELDKVYLSDGETDFDETAAIGEDTVLRITVKDKAVIEQKTITEATKYTYDKNAEAIEDTEYFKFVNCKKNGDWFLFGDGSSIEFTVGAGAVINWTRSPYDSGVVSINGVEQSAGQNGIVMFVCAEGGKIKITASASSYFKELQVVFSQTHTVEFDLDYDGAPAMDSATVLNEGKVVKPADPVREGFRFVHWYAGDDDSVAYDFNSTVTAGLTLKAKWEGLSEDEKNPVISEPLTISFGTAGNYKTVAAQGKVTVEGDNAPRDNGGNNSQLFNGTAITLKVNAGAKVVVSSYSGHTNYSVAVNGATVSASETGTSYEYTVTANKAGEEYAEVVLTSTTDDNYFYSVSVSYGLTEINASSEKKTFASTEGVDSTNFIEFTGVASHNDGTYWNLGRTGSIKIKVAAGAKITLTCSFWGVGITVNGAVQDTSTNTVTYTATEGGEIVIGCKENADNVSYLQTITIAFDE